MGVCYGECVMSRVLWEVWQGRDLLQRAGTLFERLFAFGDFHYLFLLIASTYCFIFIVSRCLRA